MTPQTVAHWAPPSMDFSRQLEQVAISFSRGCSQPRDQTQVSHIVSRLTSEPPGKPRKQYVKVNVIQSCPTLCKPTDLYSPWNSPSQNTGVGSLSLLQGISSTQGSNTGLPHCRRILYQLSHKGSPENSLKLNKNSSEYK